MNAANVSANNAYPCSELNYRSISLIMSHKQGRFRSITQQNHVFNSFCVLDKWKYGSNTKKHSIFVIQVDFISSDYKGYDELRINNDSKKHIF